MILAALGEALAFYSVIVVVIILGALEFIMGAATTRLHEWAKHLAIWLAISTLLPLVAWFTTAAFTPVADSEEFSRVQSRLNEELGSTTSPAEKDRLRGEIDRRAKESSDQERVFARRLFYVAYPVGIAAIVVGLFIPVQSVGAGLMFGGIGTLTTGCYESWTYLGPWTRLAGLVFALIVIIFLGIRRYRPVSESS